MATGHPREHGSRKGAVALHPISCRHRSQRSGSGYAELVHGFTHDIFAQHGADWRPTVATAGVGRGAGAFQLQIKAAALERQHLTQQNSTTISQLRIVATKLVSGIDAGERLRPRGNSIPCNDLCAGLGTQPVSVDSQLFCQLTIYPNGARRGDGYRRLTGVKLLREACIAIVEGDRAHSPDSSGMVIVVWLQLLGRVTA